MALIIDGKSTAERLNNTLKDSIEQMTRNGNRHPKLSVIQVGNNPASTLYIRNKQKSCESVGIIFEKISFDEAISETEVLNKINQLNRDDTCDGIVVQLPLPLHLNEEKIINTISFHKDADGFCPLTLGNVMLNKSLIYPGTPKGIVRILQEYDIKISGANIVVIGRSNIVGKPVAIMLTNLSATVTVCHSKTTNIADIAKKADILIVAIGKPKFITREFVNSNMTVIDVGINYVDNKICGDVNFEEIEPLVKAITPVPKGIGPMTVSSLLDNVFILYQQKMKS